MPGKLISVTEARERVLATVRPLAAEEVPVEDALGRVLAADVVSEHELPPFDSSAMDGFAVVAGAAAELAIVGESQAGLPFSGELLPGQAVQISTGAVIPRGADAIVPIERAEVVGDRVRVGATEPGAHVRQAGEDLHRDSVVMRVGTELGPAELGMLAALGRTSASCARRPRVAVVTTGDELIRPGRPLAAGQIYDSNETSLRALADRAGAERGGYEWIADLPDATTSVLGQIADPERGEDVICIAGGVSVGPHDLVKPALLELGFEELIWGVRLKPGKPFWFGVRDGQYAFGLPGNPVSAMVTFQLFARPALRALQGADPAATRSTAVLDGPIEANADRDQAVRCRLRMADDGWHAEPTGPQGSHVISSMLGASALAIVPAGDRGLAPGERVEIELI
jgi:molybdopterin molybdotransferase